MVKGVLGAGGEAHLIDQLDGEQLVDHGSMPSAASRSGPKRAPITDAAVNVRFAGALSRSMRAAMAACTVAGTATSATSTPQT